MFLLFNNRRYYQMLATVPNTRLGSVLLSTVVLMVILWAQTATAQNDIILVTQVLPPYSPYLSDYVSYEQKILVTLQNTKPVAKQIRLTGAFSGENGIAVTIPPGFKPAQPVMLGPNQTLMLSGVQLKEYINPDVLSFAGISKAEVLQGNGLPEGNYTLCLQALDYASGAPLSAPAPSGCAAFSITHYEPPIILQPQCNSSVQALLPQNILFTWTSPAGAPPQQVEYRLTIVEMVSPADDPNQTLLAGGNPPLFETVVPVTSFLYGPAAPKLEKGRAYAFRVTAKNKGNSKALAFKNGGKSVACSFIYGGNNNQNNQNNQENNEQADNDQPDDQPNNLDEDYVSPCEKLSCAPQPLAAGPAGVQIYHEGDEVKIGYFIMKLTKLTSTSAGNLSGEGVIDAPVFRTKLKAVFQNLQVNAQHKVFSGKAVGAYDPGAIVDEQLKNFGDNLQNIAADKVKSVADFVKSHQKYIENFVDVDAQGLPFAWKKPFSGGVQLVNIASVEFAPDGARCNAFLEFPLPEANNKILAFGQKNVCFHPTGLSVDGLQKLTMLGNDVTFAWGPAIDLTLKAANGDKGTYVKWGCEGFVSMQIDGEFVFKNEMLEKTEGNGPVKATFTFKDVGVWGDLLGVVSMDAFGIRGLKGLKFAFNDVVLDFSDTRNAQAMVFPANYVGGKGNDWRGFYFKNISVTLPPYLKKNNQGITVSLQNALINKLGFTGKVSVEPVFGIGDGNLGGWAFSIEKLGLEIVNNSLTGGGFNGKLKIPVAKTELAYDCLFSNAGQELKTTFAISNLSDLNVDMWATMLQISNGSSIVVNAQGNDVTVKAVLSGKLTIDDSYGELDLKNIKVNIPDVEFKDFTIQNKKPYITAQYFKFASPQKTFAGFPISIDPQKGIPLKSTENGDKVGLELNLSIGLDGNEQSAISGGTAFTVWAQQKQVNGKQTWLPAKPTLDSVGIKFSVAAVDVEGSINLYNGDAMFGNGFRGVVKATFRPLLELSATIQFGSTKYQNASTYRYWYVDAMAKLGTGIPVLPGFGIYGFGGGAYYHMKPPDKFPDQAALTGGQYSAKASETAGQTSTGVVYTPSKSILFGFKASLVLGTMPKPNAFNGDITLEASFFEGGGLNQISLAGNGYFVQPVEPSSRPGKDAVVVAKVMFEYSTPKKSFDGLIDIQINLKAGKKNLIVGGGYAAMHFSQNKWFIKFGDPDDRIGLTVLDLIAIDSYLMIGKNSLGPMPPLPTSPINFQQWLPYFNDQNPRKPATNTGSGFALGQQLSVDTGKLKFLIFYARIALAFGYDISILDVDQACEFAEGKMGLNGWYATGQVYAGVEATIGIDINLWFIKADVKLLEVGLYAGLQAGLPNPTWVKGQVTGQYSVLNGALSGSCTFKFKWGDYCDPDQGDPFGGLKVISDLVPTGGDVDVFSFPEVSFNLPVGPNEPISVEGINQDNEVVVSTFRFDVKTFEVRRKNGNLKVAGSSTFANKRMSSIFTPDEMFEPYTAYTVKVEIHGDRLVKGVWKRIKKCDNCADDHVEAKTKDFTTGEAPENFRNDNIVETRPGRMQRYYHFGESGKMFVRFKQYPSNIPAMEPKDQDYKYIFRARFQELGAGSKVVAEIPLEWVNTGDFKGVRFTTPPLTKEKTYIIQFVRSKVKKAGLGLNNQVKAQGSQSGNFESTTEKQSIGGGQYINVRKNRLNAIQLGDDEFLVYQLAFRTSKYSRYKDKYEKYFNEGSKKSVTQGEGAYKNTVYAQYEGDEAPDWYDLNQTWFMTASQKNYIEPTLQAEAVVLVNKTTHDQLWHNLYYDYYQYWYESSYFRPRLGRKFLDDGKVNPNMLREYPAQNAYLPGSRLTNGSLITEEYFPVHAVGISYQGTGNSGKLTNNEINAVYWKGLDDVEPGPGNGIGMQINGKISLNGSDNTLGNGLMGGNNAKKKNEFNSLVVRYDVVTTIAHDRQLVYEEIIYRYPFQASTFSMNPDFWSFMRHNAPKETAKAIGVENYNYDNDYLKIELKQNTNMKVEILYPGQYVPRQISFKLSD